MSKKKWSFNQASRIAGQLYGTLLLRDSDPEGYEWCIDELSNGRLSVRDLVRKFCTSEEYREKNIMNQTPNELARILCQKFWGRRTVNPEEVKTIAVMLLEKDWRETIEYVINSQSYEAIFGEDKIPA